jgi:1-acyl-sn-glycerol-3-phosphate acyltransferase
MDAMPYATPPRWWSPRLRLFWIHLLRRGRIWMQGRRDGLVDVQIHGLEHLQRAVDQGCGVLITSNHATHADPFVLLAAGDRLGRPFYHMVAWQSFYLLPRISRLVIRWHGCFSVDREGNDVRAFRQAVDVVAHRPQPLAVFAQGEVYHNARRLTPFRSGVARIALSAGRHSDRPIVCVPAAITYRYLEDPTPALRLLCDRLERTFLWQGAAELPLAERVGRLREGFLTLKELEHLGRVAAGPTNERMIALAETILQRLESPCEVVSRAANIPERVTHLRRRAIRHQHDLPPDDPRRLRAGRDLEDLFTAVQLYSYAEDDLAGNPPIEHVAEILDRLEEDVLRAPTASPRGLRRGFLLFGPPLAVKDYAEDKDAPRALTAALEQQVRRLMEEVARIADDRPGLRTAAPRPRSALA